MRLLPLAPLLPLVVHVQAHAQAQGPAAAPQGPSLFPLVLALVFVLALIPAAIWLLKRMGAGTQAGAAGLRVVAQLPLGTRERVVVVEAGDRWLLLGVTASSINRVGTLPKGALPAAPTPANFAALLNAARGKRDA
jgi:flagellar protein FliO/FliZ